jgi:hypothetical protein
MRPIEPRANQSCFQAMPNEVPPAPSAEGCARTVPLFVVAMMSCGPLS